MTSIIDQYKKLLVLGKLNLKTTADLIAKAQQLDPSIKTRDEALKLANKLKSNA